MRKPSNKPLRPRVRIEFPFIVVGPRSRLVKVQSTKFSTALSKVLSLYPSKFIKTQFASRMELIDAIEEAKKKSLKSPHKQYVVLTEDKDFEVENQFSLEKGMEVYTTFHKGKKEDGPAVTKLSEDGEPVVAKAPKRGELPTEKELKKGVKLLNTQTKETVKTGVKKSVKKPTAKVATEKVVKPSTSSKGSSQVVQKSGKKISGVKVTISTNDMITNIQKKGYKYYKLNGERRGESTLQKREDKVALHEMIEVRGE